MVGLSDALGDENYQGGGLSDVSVVSISRTRGWS